MTKSVKQHRDIKGILDAIFEVYDVGSDSIIDKSRFPRVVKLRFATWYILHHVYGWSMGEIGLVFDRHQTNVLRGVKQADLKVVRKIKKHL